MLRTSGPAAARIAAGIAGLGLAAALFVPAALGHPSATTPKLVGNSKAGKVAFVSTCGACHTLKAAGALGQIGPNLDKVSLSQALLIKAITNGGSSIMTKAQIAKYTDPDAALQVPGYEDDPERLSLRLRVDAQDRSRRR